MTKNMKQLQGLEKKKQANNLLITNKVNTLFADSNYTYDCSNGFNARSIITGHCKIHNKTFNQMVQTTLLGNHKCSQCLVGTKVKMSVDDWKNKVQEKNNQSANFDKFIAIDSLTPSIITCSLCNTDYCKSLYKASLNFFCRSCSTQWHAKENIKTTFEIFKTKCDIKFNNAFIYAKNTWIDYHTPMQISYNNKEYWIKPIRHFFAKFGTIHPFELDCAKEEHKIYILNKLKNYDDYSFNILEVGQRSRGHSIIEGICPNGHTSAKILISWLKFKEGCSVCSKSQYIRTKEDTLIRLEQSRPGFTFTATDYRVAKDNIDGICPNGHKSSKPLLEWEKYPCAKCLQWQSSFELDIATKIKEIIPEIVILERHKIDKKEADLYFPDYNFAIEAHGIYWHSEASNKHKKYEAKTTNHRDKYLHFKNHNIRLIQIYENEWSLDQDKILKLILSILQPQTTIGARQTTCKEISNTEANLFYHQHHLQGATRSIVSYGLFNKINPDTLIASMSFSKGNAIRQGEQWELCRFAHSEKIIGGASKLFKTFLDNNIVNSDIISFSDNRWFTGNVYKQLGFTENTINSHRPDYQYTSTKIKDKLIPKNKMRRSNIPSMLKEYNIADDYNPDTDIRTESQMAEVLKLYKIYDAGKTRWEFTK